MTTNKNAPRRPVMWIGAALVAIGAWFGAAGLVAGFLSLGDIESRLPFGSPVLAGIALALLVALPFSMLARRSWFGRSSTGATAMIAGVLLMGWIVVQLLVIRDFSPFQPVYFAVGGAFAFAGWRTRAKGRAVVDPAVARAFLDRPRIAVIGASADPKKFGNTVFRALRDHGIEVVPVNPRATDVDGVACVARIRDLGPTVDAAMIMLAGDAAVEAVEECGAHGIRHVWLFRGAGAGALSERALQAGERFGIEVVPGACPLMFLPPASGVHSMHLHVRRLVGAVGDASTFAHR